MFIWNEVTNTFSKRCLIYLKDVLKDLGLTFKQNRLYYQNVSYPLTIIIFEGEDKLGFFDPVNYRLGINIRLSYEARTNVLKDILRHELAHFLTYIMYPNARFPHGEEFKAICDRYHLPDDVKKAAINLEKIEEEIVDLEADRVIAKVKKLLRLASSDNPHEAELATIKANQLILEHNVQKIKLREKSETATAYGLTVLQGKQITSKMHAIYQILTEFFVSPVFLKSKGNAKLEVVGSKENVELASYVATFLDRKLEDLWIETKQEHPELSGIQAKNNFMRGVADGYKHKLHISKNNMNNQSLVTISKELVVQTNLAYGRLGRSISRSKIDETSHQHGISKGQKLSITPGIKSSGPSKFLLPFHKKS